MNVNGLYRSFQKIPLPKTTKKSTKRGGKSRKELLNEESAKAIAESRPTLTSIWKAKSLSHKFSEPIATERAESFETVALHEPMCEVQTSGAPVEVEKVSTFATEKTDSE